MDDGKQLRLAERLSHAWHFFADGVWDIEMTSLSRIRRFGIAAVRVVQLIWKGFREDQCALHASALTYSTLMSIVPVLAVSLALARGFGAGEKVEDEIRIGIGQWAESFQTGPAETNAAVNIPTSPGGSDGSIAPVVGVSPEQLDQLVAQVFDSVNNINFAAMGGIGLAILLVTVVIVLGNVESSFNKVWGVPAGRPLHRKFFDYLGALVVLPILAIAATSLPIADLAARFLDQPGVSAVKAVMGSGILKETTIVVMTVFACTFLIMFMPNTPVKIGPGLSGGLVAGVLFLAWMWLCARMQVGAVQNLRIYASFAVVPIVLFWVFVSWEIILFGAEVAFALQNYTTYRMETHAHAASVRSKQALALSVVAEAAKAMTVNGPTFEIARYAREHRVPVRLLNEIVAELIRAGFLGELSDRKGLFILLKAADRLHVKDVLDVMATAGASPREIGLHRLDPAIKDAMDRLDTGSAGGLGGLTAADLVAKT